MGALIVEDQEKEVAEEARYYDDDREDVEAADVETLVSLVLAKVLEAIVAEQESASPVADRSCPKQNAKTSSLVEVKVLLQNYYLHL